METKTILTDEECRQKNKYFCPTCMGWKLCAPSERPFSDFGFLSGGAGIEFFCVDCKTVISRRYDIRS